VFRTSMMYSGSSESTCFHDDTLSPQQREENIHMLYFRVRSYQRPKSEAEAVSLLAIKDSSKFLHSSVPCSFERHMQTTNLI